jgi:short-subunit dehydrogenase
MNTGLRIIIVGATSGIGRKLAEAYAEKGSKVGITGRRKELLNEIQQSNSSQFEIACFDVTQNENIVHLETLVNKLGGLDILVYSSGRGDVSKELSWPLDKMTVNTNVNGFVEIANWGFNFFANQNSGSLVTISSVAANRGNSWAPAYSASKAFQSNYFEGLSMKAIRLKKNISIICIEPGFVDTKMAKGKKIFMVQTSEKTAQRIISVIEKKKRKSNLSLRWWLVVKIMKITPYWIYKRFL